MKKVLIVIHQLNYGGVQKSVISALNAIDYNKNQVTLYVRKNRVDLLDRVNENVRVVINEDSTRYYRKPYILWLSLNQYLYLMIKNEKKKEDIHDKIVRCLHKYQIDYEMKNSKYINEHYDIAISYIQGYTSEFVAKNINAEKKYVFWHVSSDEKHQLHSLVFQQYDRIIAVNKNIVGVLKQCYPQFSDRIGYLQNHVQSAEIIEDSELDINLKKAEVTLCSCGRLSEEKGYDLAVQAAGILKKNYVDFLWYFVGDGPMRDEIQELIISNSLENNIIITGMQKNPYQYIGNCDIFIQPSYEESFGNSIMEALILKRPVVSTKTIGGCIQIDDHRTGIIVECTGQGIATGIMELIAKEDLIERIKSNLSRIDYSSDWKRYKNDIKNLLN